MKFKLEKEIDNAVASKTALKQKGFRLQGVWDKYGLDVENIRK